MRSERNKFLQPKNQARTERTFKTSIMLFKRGLSSATTGASASIKAGLILSRTPIVTKTPSKLESVFYDYQSELEKRLTWTFPYFYYFKKGTLAEKAYSKVQKKPIFKVPGVFYPKGLPDLKHGRERSEKQEIILPENIIDSTTEADTSISKRLTPNSRITEADKKSDFQSLERALEENLYLITKQNDNWEFPSFENAQGSLLHESAESKIRELGGPHIHTWTVSNTPCKLLQDATSSTFFIKSHVLAGKFDPKDLEFAWVTKNEFKDKVSKDYYDNMQYLLN